MSNNYVGDYFMVPKKMRTTRSITIFFHTITYDIVIRRFSELPI